MENAVIYARYSSAGQNEQSIEGQLRICQEFAESKGFNVVKTYIDKARSAFKESEKRVDFQKMLADASSGTFQHIIVYKFDRFARNRVDSMMTKQQLKKQYGIRVISATEPVSDDEGGEIYEMFLEWNDEKYSQRLSKRVRDGIDTSIAKGTYCGGWLLYGYKKHKEPIPGRSERYIKSIVIDEEQAKDVRFVFEKYAEGVDKKDIATALNEQGKRYYGKEFDGKTFDKWLYNAKYTGTFYYGGRKSENMFPQIIDQELFDKVQVRLKQNQYFAAKGKATRYKFFLTGKLYCGHCGTPLVSDGGTSKSGVKHQYYACKRAKVCGCDKKREDKNHLEQYVAVETKKYLGVRRRIEELADKVILYYKTKVDSTVLKSVETYIANTKKQIDDAVNSMISAESVVTKKVLDRKINDLSILVEDLENQKSQIEKELAMDIKQENIISWVEHILKLAFDVENNKEHQRIVIDNLVNSVYIYDNKIVIYYNLNSGKELPYITFEQTNEVLKEKNTLTECSIIDECSNTNALGGEGGI